MNTSFKQVVRQLSSRKLYSTNVGAAVAKKYVFVQHFQGEPKPSDFKIEEEQLPALKDGDYLCEAEYFSVDPYMRAYMVRYPVGVTMIGSQIAKVLESKNSNFPVGSKVVGNFGWRTHTVVAPKDTKLYGNSSILPNIGDLPPSLGLGMLGMTGHTAYFGLLDICKPKEGETLVITGAAGAVGSHVGQIGKIKGLKVIGFAGSDDKCEWLVKNLGFDHAFNYKKENVTKVIKEVAPKGVNCYFDNVGGEISSRILNRMSRFGRVAICGSVGSYNNESTKLPTAPIVQPIITVQQLKLEGFLVTRWEERYNEAIQANLKWIQEGKLQYSEHVTNGFDKLFDSFVGMLRGDNFGKTIVKA